MRTLASNALNDIYLNGAGNVAIATDLEACVMSCRRACQVNLGELPYAQSRGAPFFKVMEDKDLSLYEMYIRQMLLTVPGVSEVIAVAFSFAGEQLLYTATISTIYGSGTVSNG